MELLELVEKKKKLLEKERLVKELTDKHNKYLQQKNENKPNLESEEQLYEIMDLESKFAIKRLLFVICSLLLIILGYKVENLRIIADLVCIFYLPTYLSTYIKEYFAKKELINKQIKKQEEDEDKKDKEVYENLWIEKKNLLELKNELSSNLNSLSQSEYIKYRSMVDEYIECLEKMQIQKKDKEIEELEKFPIRRKQQ